MKKGRNYTLEVIANEKDVSWSLFESQLSKLANEVEEVCGVPVTLKRKDYNSSSMEEIIKWGAMIRRWDDKLSPKQEGGKE